MNRPSTKERERGLAGHALQTEPTLSKEYRLRKSLQASLEQRLNRTASIAELMPRVLAITLAQGMAGRNR